LVPFNTIAWHAGVSTWKGRVGLNKYSIGIEIDNAGRLGRKGNQWRSTVTGNLYSDTEIIKAKHKNGTGLYGWQLYTEKQIETTLQVSLALFRIYKLLDVVGHDDIAPTRKTDPGPAFPMENFRAKIFESMTTPTPQYTLSQPALIRINPDSRSKLLITTYLPQDTRLEVLDTNGPWMLVNVLDAIEGATGLQGWVYTAYITRIPGT
jgi:N-acetylmuramoyl-L-alanine amidase